MITTNYLGWYSGYYGNANYNATSISRVDTKAEKGKNNPEYSAYLNRIDVEIETAQLQKIFCSRFSWSGCDFLKEVHDGYVESILFNNGFAVALNHPIFGFIIMPATIKGQNAFYQPLNYNVVGNGWRGVFDASDVVLIKDNDIWEAPLRVAQRQGGLIADAGRTCENLVNSAKLLDVFLADDRQTKTAEDYANYRINNVPFLIMSKKPDDEIIISSKNPRDTTEAIINMQQVKQNYRAEAHARIAVSSNEFKKTAYTSEEEMGNTMTYNSLLLESARRNRLKAIDEIKEKFGVDLELVDHTQIVEENQEAIAYDEQEDEMNKEKDKADND